MIKKAFYIALLFALVACEDKFEVTHTYSRTFYKSYPIYLEASGILVDPQVKPPVPFEAAFKIVSNDKYIFIGEMMKGIHVYEKTDDAHASPLCFIECKYMKAFDVTDNLLYCNNFTDLLVIDVENPLQTRFLHRVWEYFNQYWNSSLNLPMLTPNIRGPGFPLYEIGYKHVAMLDTITDAHPEPDFSEMDELYGNIILTEIPDTLQTDKPYARIVNVAGSYIYTLGNQNLIYCSYSPGGFSYFETSLISNYSSLMPIDKLLYKDKVMFLTGLNGGLIFQDDNNFVQRYFSIPKLKDIVSIKQPRNSLVSISQYNYQDYQLRGYILDENYNLYNYIDGDFSDATSLINVNDTILALSNQTMTLYIIEEYYNWQWDYSYWEFKQVKQYPFGGTTMLKEDDRLIVASPQGLFFYDISDLKNIVRIP